VVIIVVKEIEQLRKLCRSLGGDLIELTVGAFDSLSKVPGDFDPAPFNRHNLGMIWHERRIYHTDKAFWPEIIHEMGHVFASHEPPNKCKDEFDFFGWEYCVAEYIGGAMPEWYESNKEYSCYHFNRYTEFGKLNPHNQMALIERAIEASRTIGILDAQNKPLRLTRQLTP